MKYVSAIALKLSQLCQQYAATLTEQILYQWMQALKFDQLNLCNQLDGQFLEKIIVSVAPPGWIYFDLPAHGIAEWLQSLFEVSMIDITTSHPISLPLDRCIDPHNPKIFEILHVHHRCCCLLKLAKQEQLIPVNSMSKVGEASMGLILPWLVGDRLRCQLAVEWALITQISDTLDHLAQIDPIEHSDSGQLAPQLTFKAAYSLSRTFYAFDAACRIWGEVKRQDPDRMKVRLGLVQITQQLLQLLLQKLGYDQLREL